MVVNCMDVFAEGSLPCDPSRVIMAVYRQLCKFDIALTWLIKVPIAQIFGSQFDLWR